MLQLKNVGKIYQTESIKVEALNHVNLNFRNKEFVSILGTSGSGKTTLLNIIGGLDKYTHGDLIINNVSTKKYTDTDWDLYRNHKVGFVFQSYNLIPHQTALANVELALTLSGVGKEESRKRAIKALKSVGLGNQINKKPNQMSGGQTQRIAIARALVNDPDILLADEPTGALDSETSVQIMDLLKKISEDKLVIMVTHNPDLANKYSTRIINLSDGKIVNDSNPFDGNEDDVIEKKKGKKTVMSFKTALNLSFNNLKTKKGRTILTSFAGAIGIIGIALVMSISNGVKTYISSVEEDTLSSYPITIEAQKIDTSSLLQAMSSNNSEANEEKNTIVTNNIMGDMIGVMSSKIETNDLKTFKKYLEDNKDTVNQYANSIKYGYNINLQIYKDSTTEVLKLNPSNLFESFGYNMSEMYSSMMASAFTELMDNKKLLSEQYEVLQGRMPEKYNEVVLIVDKNNKISDYTAYSLGLKDRSELDDVMNKMISGEQITFEEARYTFDELLNLKFKVLLNTDYYKKSHGMWISMEKDNNYVLSKLKDALEIKVVGIIKPSEGSVIGSGTSYGNIGYTKELTEFVIGEINKTEIAQAQLNNKETNVFTGMGFNSGNFDYSSLTDAQKAYLASLSADELSELMSNYSHNTYESNLITLGIVDIESPSTIYIYPKDFDSKDNIKKFIDDYNTEKKNSGKDNEVISYSDLVGVLMSSVTTIVNIISYVLIAFVSVSLIVSSIMIGIITYISVLERTKEIGILRAIGASKKDISRVFNAETFIVGLFSGIIGILVTLLLNIPINIVIRKLASIKNLSQLPFVAAIILVIISIGLTIVAGLIPSSIASKKDPVEALRSE